MNSIHHAATTFIGQNTGAKKIEQIKKLSVMLNLIVFATGVLLSAFVVGFGKNLIGFYTDTPQAIRFGIIHLAVMGAPYFVCGLMDVTVGCIRGMGTSLSPMLVSIFGVCGIRLIWIWVIFPFIRKNIENVYSQYFFLFLSYIISWIITFICQVIIWNKTYKTLKKRYL